MAKDKNGHEIHRDANKGFAKGKSGNPNGRPTTPYNQTPMGMLSNALEAGLDLGNLKDLALKLVQDKDTKMTPAQVERIISKLFDVELELMKRAEIAEEKKSKSKVGKKTKTTSGGSGGIFSTTAEG